MEQKGVDLKFTKSDAPCSLETSLSDNAAFFLLLPSLRCFSIALVKLSQAESGGQAMDKGVGPTDCQVKSALFTRDLSI